MRIAYVSDLSPPDSIGGAERVMMTEAEEMAKNGHEVHIIALGPGCGRDTLTDHNHVNGKISMHFLGRPRLDIYDNPSLDRKLATMFLGVYDPVFAGRLRRALAKIRPEIVHSHYCYRISYGALSSAVKGIIPWVHTFHDYVFECPKGSIVRSDGRLCLTHPWYCRLRNRAFQHSIGIPDKIIAISSFVEGRLLSAGFPEEKIARVPNPVKIPQKRSEPQYERFILFVGRLEPNKGIEQFSREFSKTQDSSLSLVIAGTGSRIEALKGIARVSTPAITVLGRITEASLDELYSKCRALVFPSLWSEVLPLVPLECMSHAKAVVASDIGGIRDIVTNQLDGFTVPGTQMQLMVEKCRLLLEDIDLARRMGLKAMVKANEFCTDNHMMKLENLYAQVLDDYVVKNQSPPSYST